MSSASSLVVVGVAPDRLGADVLDAWNRLFESQAAPSNPFLAPTWVLEWYQAFVAPGDGVVIVVRRPGRDGQPGDVIGIAPMFVQRPRLGPVVVARRLLPVGAGIGQTPFEIPGYLATAGSAREVAEAIVTAGAGLESDWAEIAVDPGQGWFDLVWLAGLDAPTAFYDHVRPRACVVLPLAETWDATRATFKRNIKESLRRSANRLKKDGRPYEVVRRGDDLDHDVVRRFLALHRARAEHTDSTSHHPDAYQDATHRRLMLAALPELARQGRASIFELYLDGEHVASQLALHSPGTSYVHSSGFRHDTWALGVVTHLQGELVRYAIERGDKIVNFSPGPNVAKLRWSEQLWVTNEFAYGVGPRSLMARFSIFTFLSSMRSIRHENSRRSRAGSAKPPQAPAVPPAAAPTTPPATPTLAAAPTLASAQRAAGGPTAAGAPNGRDVVPAVDASRDQTVRAGRR